MLIQYFSFTAKFEHSLQGSLMTTFWLQRSSPDLLKMSQSTKGSHYSIGHDISTTNALGKRGLQRTCKTQPVDTTMHSGSHTQVAGGSHWLEEYRKQAKQTWGTSTLMGFTHPQIAECTSLFICINSRRALFPLDLPLKYSEESKGWSITFSSVQCPIMRELRRGTGTRAHLPVEQVMHWDFCGQNILFLFGESTAPIIL